MKYLNTSIDFIQETHLRPEDHLRIRKGWVGQLYHSSFQSKSRGVAILIHKSVPFSVAEVISDPNGRFIFLRGQINGVRLILANIYGPNWDDEAFFKKVLFPLLDLYSNQLILGGDFNCCLDPLLDRSSSRPCALSKSGRIIRLFMEQYAVSDVWRFLNSNTKQFSFFSPVHHSFSHIDYFLVYNKLLPLVSSCIYNNIVISDHAAVTFDLALPGLSISLSPWRFNSLLLNDPDFIAVINDHIDLFISPFHSSNLVNSPSWLHIENASCNKSSSLASLLCLPCTKTLIKYSNNIIVKNSFKIWTQFVRHFSLHNTPLLSPIHSNPLFYPSILDNA